MCWKTDWVSAKDSGVLIMCGCLSTPFLDGMQHVLCCVSHPPHMPHVHCDTATTQNLLNTKHVVALQEWQGPGAAGIWFQLALSTHGGHCRTPATASLRQPRRPVQQASSCGRHCTT